MNLPAREILYKAGDPAEEVYFIFSGIIKLLDEQQGLEFKIYKDGSYFGDHEVVFKLPRDSTAMAAVECQLLVIKKSEFLRVLSEFPKEEMEVKRVAAIRKEKHQEAMEGRILD